MTAERKIFISAAIYAILGLVAGLFGRTYTHSMGMEDSNHLSVLHTHILTLGFFFFLITLALEKLYTLSSQKSKVLKISQLCKNKKHFFRYSVYVWLRLQVTNFLGYY